MSKELIQLYKSILKDQCFIIQCDQELEGYSIKIGKPGLLFDIVLREG